MWTQLFLQPTGAQQKGFTTWLVLHYGNTHKVLGAVQALPKRVYCITRYSQGAGGKKLLKYKELFKFLFFNKLVQFLLVLVPGTRSWPFFVGIMAVMGLQKRISMFPDRFQHSLFLLGLCRSYILRRKTKKQNFYVFFFLVKFSKQYGVYFNNQIKIMPYSLSLKDFFPPL